MSPSHDTTPPPSDPEYREGLLREVFRRVLESGAKSLTSENLRQAARELRLPKDVLQHLLSQVEEGKSAFYRVAAQEVRSFLERSNLAEEFARALTLLTFEAKMEVRFRSNEKSHTARPDVSTSVRVKRTETNLPEEHDAPPAPVPSVPAKPRSDGER